MPSGVIEYDQFGRTGSNESPVARDNGTVCELLLSVTPGTRGQLFRPDTHRLHRYNFEFRAVPRAAFETYMRFIRNGTAADYRKTEDLIRGA